MLLASASDVVEVFESEMIGRMGAHIQLSDTKINGVCSCLHGCNEALSRANGGHDLKICCLLLVHHVAKLRIKNIIFVCLCTDYL